MDYKNDNVWLMQGDCLERMKEIPDSSVDGGGRKMDREQKLRDVGWDILASANDCLFVVKNMYGDVQVLHFFYDSKYGEHMVEGYFASSFDHKAQDELFEAPDKFLDKFYLYCSKLMEDWCTKEDNLYK